MNRYIAVSVLSILLAGTGCSVRTFAVKKIGDAIAGSGTTFASDDDPQLVREAVPFSLKLIESLLAETPRHQGLLLAASRGFTQYAYAFVQEDADEMEHHDLTAATELRGRAKRLYLRARDYGLRALEVKYPGFQTWLPDPSLLNKKLTKSADVPILYWTAASWGAAISISKDDPGLIADQPIVEALIDQALRLDEKFDSGSIHGFLINYEQVRQGAIEDAALRSQKHFDRALELSQGKLASPFVSLAEAVCIGKQDRTRFEALLSRALAVDPNARPEWKLENLVMQRRARWLLARMDELFLEQEGAQNRDSRK
jgi:predicted anti-sigma-YlaC factor YlaD